MMRDVYSSTHDEVRVRASHWVVRAHADDFSDTEREAFTRWYAAAQTNAKTYDEILEIWNGSETLQADQDESYAAVVEESRRLRPRWPSALAPYAVAAGIVFAMIGFFIYRDAAEIRVQRYATRVGEQRVIVLEDGSRITLDTATVVEVDYQEHERRVLLKGGQVEFDVRKETARPFRVMAGRAEVTVTGTRFQIRDNGANKDVILLEGNVLVGSKLADASGRKIEAHLTPGEKIQVGSDGRLGQKLRVDEIEIARLNGWTAGQLVIREWPLKRVLTEINRYSETKIELVDPALGEMPISGRFKTGDSLTFADSLEYGWQVDAEQTENGDIIIRRRQ